MYTKTKKCPHCTTGICRIGYIYDARINDYKTVGTWKCDNEDCDWCELLILENKEKYERILR